MIVKPSFCGACIETRPDLVQRPIGKNDAMVWICGRCDHGAIGERDHLFGGKPGGIGLYIGGGITSKGHGPGSDGGNR